MTVYEVTIDCRGGIDGARTLRFRHRDDAARLAGGSTYLGRPATVTECQPSPRLLARFGAAGAIADQIPLGQPILVGHHSERRARRDADRIHSNMAKGCEETALAQHHAARASGLEAQLERSVFSDDVDAVEVLEARIAKREEFVAKAKAVNKAWRKEGRDEVARQFGERLADTAAETMRQCPWLKSPLSTTNEAASIRRDRERIEEIRRRQARTAAAEDAGGVTIVSCGTTGGITYVRVTFAERPERDVLEDLRAAGFRWGGGSWVGDEARLPESVRGAAR